MTELEKANKTIEELKQLNQELAASRDAIFARNKIDQLEHTVADQRRRLEKLERKLTNRKLIIKDVIKEMLAEVLNED